MTMTTASAIDGHCLQIGGPATGPYTVDVGPCTAAGNQVFKVRGATGTTVTMSQLYDGANDICVDNDVPRPPVVAAAAATSSSATRVTAAAE